MVITNTIDIDIDNDVVVFVIFSSNLIIPHCRLIHQQWGTTTDNTETRFPINFNNQLLKVFITSIGKASSTIAKEVTVISNNSFMVYTNPKPGGGSYYFVIGS